MITQHERKRQPFCHGFLFDLLGGAFFSVTSASSMKPVPSQIPTSSCWKSEPLVNSQPSAVNYSLPYSASGTLHAAPGRAGWLAPAARWLWASTRTPRSTLSLPSNASQSFAHHIPVTTTLLGLYCVALPRPQDVRLPSELFSLLLWSHRIKKILHVPLHNVGRVLLFFPSPEPQPCCPPAGPGNALLPPTTHAMSSSWTSCQAYILRKIIRAS